MIKRITRTTNLEYSIKMLISLVVGLLVAKLIGYPNVVTVPITSYLVCWSYRGLRGSIEYFGFRMRIQILFVIVDTLAWMALAYIWPDSLAWHRFALLSCILVPIYLQVYYRFKIMPLNLTAVFSTLIILAGLMGTPYYGSRRLLWNICGLIIGCALTYLIPSLTKLSKVRDSLVNISDLLLAELGRIVSAGMFGVSADCTKAIPDITTEITTITAYIAVVDKDLTKATAFPMRLLPSFLYNSRYQSHLDEIREIHCLLSVTGALLALVNHIKASSAGISALSDERKSLYIFNLAQIVSAHKAALDSAASSVPGVFTQPENDEEVLLLNRMLGYATQVAKLGSASCGRASACTPVCEA